MIGQTRPISKSRSSLSSLLRRKNGPKKWAIQKNTIITLEKKSFFCREQGSTDAGADQNKLREASWKIEIYMNVEEEEGSSVEKEPFKGGQRQLSDGC